MGICLLDLPNELLEIILFYIIGRPWKGDVCDFLSFTSTCQHLRQFVHDERYWRMMVLRRDPTCENVNWFEYCKQVYSQRTIPGDALSQPISRYNDNYFCTIEKVSLWPNRIRVYIDEHGDNSLGPIQDPVDSIIAFLGDQIPVYNRPVGGIKVDHSKFSIADEKSEYLGYLDFPYSISFDNIGKNLVFQYGISSYANAILFRIDPTFITRYNLIPLLKNIKNLPHNHLLLRRKSN
jgi:hypothetical protein